MISDEKIAAVRSKLKKGIPEGELKHELREEGFSDEDINKCLDGYRYSMKNWYFLFGILLIASYMWHQSLTIATLGAVLLSLYFREKINQLIFNWQRN